MQALKPLVLLSLFVLNLFASSVFGQNAVDYNDHAALVKHYENLAKEAEAKLQENKEALEEYEAHPYYYGRQGQDLQSHTAANIHEYEEIVKGNLENADLHRKMIGDQANPINKAKLNLDSNSATVR